MGETIAVVILAASLLLLGWAWIRFRTKRLVRERLFRDMPAEIFPLRLNVRSQSRTVAAIVVLVVGVAAGLIVLRVLGWGVAFAVAFGFLFGVSTLLALSSFSGMRAVKTQSQLADAIDMMVASLQAGAGLLEALQSAARESRRPLKRNIEALLIRIQVGESPVEVCRTLSATTDIEAFRLFYSTLAVQWESGGSVAPVLSDVGRFVRDNLETIRRVRSQMAEVRLSVLGVLALTYVIGLVMWRAYPERLQGFLSLGWGRAAAATALTLQALGALWIYRLSRIRY